MQFSIAPGRPLGRRLAAIVAVAILAVTTLAVVEPADATVAAINSNRSGAGMAPVEDHGGLASLAAQHAQAMADEGRLYHTSNLGSRVSSVVPDWQAVAENVGMGDSMEQVNEAFMQSSSHRANILGDFNLAGVGSATDAEGRIWVTQVFARVPTAPPPPPPPPTAAPPPPVPDDRVQLPRVSRSRPSTPVEVPAADPLPGFVAGVLAAPALGRWRDGYFLFGTDGGVLAHDGAAFAGSLAGSPLAAPIVAGATTPRGDGYWLAAADGGVFALGVAEFHGSLSGTALAEPVVGVASANRDGYWLAAADGGVFAFGRAGYYGGLVNVDLQEPVVAMAATPSGKGYWLATADGGVFAFGDADHFGALGHQQLNEPVTAMAATSSGNGYWLVAADGGVFAFGDAVHAGGLAGSEIDSPIRAIVPRMHGAGYRLVSASGDVSTFGDDAAPASSRGYLVYSTLVAR